VLPLYFAGFNLRDTTILARVSSYSHSVGQGLAVEAYRQTFQKDFSRIEPLYSILGSGLLLGAMVLSAGQTVPVTGRAAIVWSTRRNLMNL
jgi:hypothetical protein